MKYYRINYFYDYIEIIINELPYDKYNKIKLYYDLELYLELDYTKVKYKDIFFNKKELKFLLNI